MLRVPFEYLEVDRTRLRQQGYALPDDLTFVADLPLDAVKANTDYGMKYPPV